MATWGAPGTWQRWAGEVDLSYGTTLSYIPLSPYLSSRPCICPHVLRMGEQSQGTSWLEGSSSLAVVERVNGAGPGSHSLPEEKPGQRLFLYKRCFSFLIRSMW